VVLAVVVSQLSSDGIDVKALAMIGVLTACGAALRTISPSMAGISFVFILMIAGARVGGAACGFGLGTTTMFASALLTAGFGPWLPYQMIASGFVSGDACGSKDSWGLVPRLKGQKAKSISHP